jgi:hypothetical protein
MFLNIVTSFFNLFVNKKRRRRKPINMKKKNSPLSCYKLNLIKKAYYPLVV